MKISDIKLNPSNPREINDEKFRALVKSLKELPVMTKLRKVILDENNVIIGGNMRYRVALEMGWKDIPVEVFTREMAEENNKITKQNKTYEEYVNEIIIKDNIEFGNWNYDLLSSQYEIADLLDWGLTERDLQLNDFNPNINPSFDNDDVTQEEINRKAKELAEQMIKEKKKFEVICPECGHEFTIDS